MDLWGLGMLAVGMGALQVMLDKGQEKDRLGRVLPHCGAGGDGRGLLPAFVIRELRVDQPIVRFRLLKAGLSRPASLS